MSSLLRDIMELECSGQKFVTDYGKADLSVRCAMAVRFLFRHAKQMLKEGSEKQLEAVTLMYAFISAMDAITATAVGESALQLFARHMAARAYGALGDHDFERTLNEGIWEDLFEWTDTAKESEDLLFVRTQVFWALIEADSDLFSPLGLDSWAERIRQLEESHHPNFSGRALFLAKRYVEAGRPMDAVALLTRAVACNFGDLDEIAEAQAYRAELEKMLPPEPQEG